MRLLLLLLWIAYYKSKPRWRIVIPVDLHNPVAVGTMYPKYLKWTYASLELPRKTMAQAFYLSTIHI
jgi:hypothetical protein